jgi:hypothetical protein
MILSAGERETVVEVAEMRNAYKVLVGKHEEKK